MYSTGFTPVAAGVPQHLPGEQASQARLRAGDSCIINISSSDILCFHSTLLLDYKWRMKFLA